MQGIRFDGQDPVPTGKGRPISITAGDWVLESAIGHPREIAVIRRWFQDPVFAAPLGRRPEDPGEDAVRSYIDRFDRLLNHLFMVRDADRNETAIAMVQIDGTNRIAWLETMVGRTHGDTQNVMSAVGRAMARWVFEDLGLAKVSVQCAASNGRTSAWLARSMTLEATLREELLLPDGRRETLLRYAVLASEWNAVKQGFAQRDATGVPTAIPRRPR